MKINKNWNKNNNKKWKWRKDDWKINNYNMNWRSRLQDLNKEFKRRF